MLCACLVIKLHYVFTQVKMVEIALQYFTHQCLTSSKIIMRKEERKICAKIYKSSTQNNEN